MCSRGGGSPLHVDAGAAADGTLVPLGPVAAAGESLTDEQYLAVMPAPPGKRTAHLIVGAHGIHLSCVCSHSPALPLCTRIPWTGIEAPGSGSRPLRCSPCRVRLGVVFCACHGLAAAGHAAAGVAPRTFPPSSTAPASSTCASAAGRARSRSRRTTARTSTRCCGTARCT